MVNQKKRRTQSLYQLMVIGGILIFLNLLSSAFFTRIDLTADKRFTLSDSTKQFLKQLPDVVFVKVYLDGDMPGGFQRLKNATRDLLDEMKVYAGANLQYQFEDPFAGKSEDEKQKIVSTLYEQGLDARNVESGSTDQYSNKLLVPGAIITYLGKSTPVNFLKDAVGSENALNNSISQLENGLTTAFQKLKMHVPEKIAFLYGQGEIPLPYESDFAIELSKYYSLEEFNASNILGIPKEYEMLIIAKPIQSFNDSVKYWLDQYVMHGGKILWMVESLHAEIDSLTQSPMMMAMDYNLNLDDILFKYGVRINPVLVQDLMCNTVPLLANYDIKKQPQFAPFPCLYFPVITPDYNHVITNGLDAISTEFISSIDTNSVKGIKKTILLHTSDSSRVLPTPWMVDFRELRKPPQKEYFTQKKIPMAVLLEGKFESVFKNRLPEKFLEITRDSFKMPFQDVSVPNKMIVISDGDIGKNDIRNNQPMPLGYHWYNQQYYFNNKAFLMNCVDYLNNHPDHITTRAKTVKLRLLDKSKIAAERIKWEMINLIIPVLLSVFGGLIYILIRKQKFSH